VKREAMAHTKMKRLCRRLDLPLWQAVGLLECLWHLTAREAPRGDIGKLSDEDIALALDYRGDESVMIEALVQSGWLDRHPTERLSVHDWADHSDDATNMRLARSRQFFCCGRPPKLTKLTNAERDAAHKFYFCAPEPEHGVRTDLDVVRTPCAQNGDLSALPEPEPVPVPEPVPPPEPELGPVPVRARGPVAADATEQPSQRFDAVWQLWPRKVGRDSAARDWLSLVTVANEARVFACVWRYLKSSEVACGKVRNLGTKHDRPGWLVDCAKDQWACDWPQARESNGKGPNSAELTESIRAFRGTR
jgi:hypothetical protein